MLQGILNGSGNPSNLKADYVGKSVNQLPMITGSSSLKTKVMKEKKDWDEVFPTSFSELFAVTYVASPEILIGYLNENSNVEIVVGDSLSNSYKEKLGSQEYSVTEQLSSYVMDGRLKIYDSPKTIHSKLYIYNTSVDYSRVILGSANLTKTASQPAKQTNYVWYGDFHQDDDWLKRIKKDYESHKQEATMFMNDLAELLGRNPADQKQQYIMSWLNSGQPDSSQNQPSKINEEIVAQINSASETQDVVSLTLDSNRTLDKPIKKFLAEAGANFHDNKVELAPSQYIDYVYKQHGLPILDLDYVERKMSLYISGSRVDLAEEMSNQSSVFNDLAHLEDYLNTVDSGESTDPEQVKTSIFEALLYIFTSPFFCEFMRTRRLREGNVNKRGPKFLYIYGPTMNGKSTFLRFALKLMTSWQIEPLQSNQFTKRNLMSNSQLATGFPMVFDDISFKKNPQGIEDVFKLYWETSWRDDQKVYPQIIMTSNDSRLKPWAKSRTKRISFNVLFSDNHEDREKLSQLIKRDNSIYKWFAYLYMDELRLGQGSSDDELHIARNVFKKLYDYAGRALPDYFPEIPIENKYDTGRTNWQDLLYGIKKAKLSGQGSRQLINFDDDVQTWEIKEYLTDLPQNVKYQHKGKTLVIENPKIFSQWIALPNKGLFQSILGWLPIHQ